MNAGAREDRGSKAAPAGATAAGRYVGWAVVGVALVAALRIAWEARGLGLLGWDTYPLVEGLLAVGDETPITNPWLLIAWAFGWGAVSIAAAFVAVSRRLR